MDKEFSIYEVPLGLAEHRLDEQIVQKLGCRPEPLRMDDWQALMRRIRHPEAGGDDRRRRQIHRPSGCVQIDLRGPRSCRLRPLGPVKVKRIEAEELETQDPDALLAGVDGILVPGGFGMRGVEGKVQACRFARDREIPYFGICLGMQCAVIEFARSVLQLSGANSTEFETGRRIP